MKNQLYLLLILSCFLFLACHKEDEFLDKKPRISLLTPTTLNDYQKLLYNEGLFNSANSPALGAITSEEYYVTPAYWAGRGILDRNLYIFKEGDIYESSTSFSAWETPYTQVYYANTVLDGISKLTITPDQQTLYNQIKGQALFFRSFAFYNLVETFALPFDSATASSDLGIPLRLSSDFNVPIQRSTVKQTYDRILSDLNVALDILPVTTAYPTQPTKIAGTALLARIYLAMRNYPKALEYASATLTMNNALVDYNTLTPTNTYLSATYLKEDIFQTLLQVGGGIYSFNGSTMVDSALYNLYDDPNDLRKTVCYRINAGRVEWRGTYAVGGIVSKYCGLATDEMYLIRAECFARMGNLSGAMADVNTLLRARWKKVGVVSTYIDKTASSASAALTFILRERRKELPFRGLRWTDIRRLNFEPGFQTTLKRVLNDLAYILPPGDPRFAMPIPPDEIQLSGIPQNNR